MCACMLISYHISPDTILFSAACAAAVMLRFSPADTAEPVAARLLAAAALASRRSRFLDELLALDDDPRSIPSIISPVSSPVATMRPINRTVSTHTPRYRRGVEQIAAAATLAQPVPDHQPLQHTQYVDPQNHVITREFAHLRQIRCTKSFCTWLIDTRCYSVRNNIATQCLNKWKQ